MLSLKYNIKKVFIIYSLLLSTNLFSSEIYKIKPARIFSDGEGRIFLFLNRSCHATFLGVVVFPNLLKTKQPGQIGIVEKLSSKACAGFDKPANIQMTHLGASYLLSQPLTANLTNKPIKLHLPQLLRYLPSTPQHGSLQISYNTPKNTLRTGFLIIPGGDKIITIALVSIIQKSTPNQINKTKTTTFLPQIISIKDLMISTEMRVEPYKFKPTQIERSFYIKSTPITGMNLSQEKSRPLKIGYLDPSRKGVAL